ncbi:hypothetical protein M9H77_02757 [Catharanthus roseus]|uniref:Uncharacterized protein n=1 Tax=Catharanthus roseus TaxID=4058 RepID=A0ACC0C9A0_CATRO|nr:hypothetical protein M9H77_02757 [Catharanthus roseus]
MEEVSVHVLPGPIVPDVLTRQYEHRSMVPMSGIFMECMTDRGNPSATSDLGLVAWYRDITRVYIGNPARCDTRTSGYQPVGVDRQMMTCMLQEVDDMTTWVLEGPPSSLTQYTSVMRKVQTIICRCMVSIGSTLDVTSSQHDI